MPKRLRIVTKHSPPLWMATDTVSEQPEKRARLLETHAEVDPETFALTLESRGTLETHTELNVSASDLHEPDPEEMWSNDLGWVPKSALQAAREKEVTKLQEFDTFEEVRQHESEGEVIISRFCRQVGHEWRVEVPLGIAGLRGKSDRSGFTRRCNTVGHGNKNCAGVGTGAGRGHGPGGHFWSLSSCSCETTFPRQKPPVEYRKPGIVWRMKRYLYDNDGLEL